MFTSTAQPPVVGRVQRRWFTQKRVDGLSAYALLAPFLILLFVFSVYVFASGLRLSFTDAQRLTDGDWIGLQNYRDVLGGDKYLWKELKQALLVTGGFTIGCLITQVPVAFILAYTLNTIPLPKIRTILRAAFFLPVLINTVVVGFLFRLFFEKDAGIVNGVLGMLHLPSHIDWLRDSNLALPLLILVAFWQWTGFHMVYFLAQLQTVDPSLYEAGKMDGISSRGALWYITLPLMRPAIIFVMVTSAIGCLQMFDLVFMLFPNAGYGPGGVAKTMVAMIYDQGFSQGMVGLSAAIGWITFLIIATVSAVQLRLFGLGKHGEA